MSQADVLELSMALLAIGALASLAVSRRRRLCGWTSLAFVTAASVAVWVVVIRTFLHGPAPEATLLVVPIIGARLAVAVDGLSAVFLAIASVIATLSTLFSVDYMTHYRHDSLAKFYPVLQLFFLSMIGVLVTADLLALLVFWELMTLTSFFLVTFERESAASQRAGLKYFVITHAATLCMLAAILVLWRTSAAGLSFAAMRETFASLLAHHPYVGHLVILLLSVGFATKAGVLPMGDWLPDAHPVAPSSMSAVLSGALVKLGIYGLLRLFCSFLPLTAGLPTWGIVLALAGTISLFVGTLTALQQTDSKRLMAFHTIGQIGYICLGLGVGVYALADQVGLAALALMGAILHAANHACFKACLFLGAGAVIFRTGERDMDKLGGLGSQLPITGAASTVASLSIAGVPPLNGFASKWLIIASCLLLGMTSPLFLVLGLVALFISLATLASFLKVLGAVFLGPKREDQAVREVPLTMTVPQVVLAGLCVLLGLLPQLPLQHIWTAVATAVPAAVPPTEVLLGESWGLSLSAGGVTFALWAPLYLTLGLVVLGALAFGIQRLGGAPVREVPVWTGGESHSWSVVRYPASSLYRPFKHAFQGIYPAFRLRAPRFPKPLRSAFDVDRWLYGPLAHSVDWAAKRVSRTHVGTPQIYLLWIVVGAALVVATMLALVA